MPGAMGLDHGVVAISDREAHLRGVDVGSLLEFMAYER